MVRARRRSGRQGSRPKKRDELAAHLDAGRAGRRATRGQDFRRREPQPEEATTVTEPPGGWDRSSAARGRPAVAVVEAETVNKRLAAALRRDRRRVRR